MRNASTMCHPCHAGGAEASEFRHTGGAGAEFGHAGGAGAEPPTLWSNSGFTLLEILVVVVVMILLMGITFRLVAPATSASDASGTIKNLNLLKAAIEEYHAEYGIYPPATDKIGGNSGKYVDSDGKGKLCVTGCGAAPGVSCGYIMPMAISRRLNGKYPFCFGLLSFLVDRRSPTTPGDDNGLLEQIYKGVSPEEIIGDFGGNSHWGKNGKALRKAVTLGALYGALAPSDRDIHFFKRVKPYLDEANLGDKHGVIYPNNPAINCYYYSIHDAWDQDLVYICPPPHTGYALFSAGPDHKCVASDPLNRDAKCPSCGQYHNRDNVYAAVGDR